MNLENLTPSELAALKAKLDGLGDGGGRSPLRPRQLHDLRLLPTATDPRPTFFWSAEGDRNTPIGPGSLYPRLMWHRSSGLEITVHSADAETAMTAEYTVTPPIATTTLDPLASMKASLESLSDEERALLLDAQQQDRLELLRQKLAAMPQADLDRLMEAFTAPAPAVKAKKSA